MFTFFCVMYAMAVFSVLSPLVAEWFWTNPAFEKVMDYNLIALYFVMLPTLLEQYG